MDPVEKSQLIACHVPARPNLSRGWDGKGRQYWTLSYRHPGKFGRSDCKERLYLGVLTPLQVIAVKQVIADAWPERRRSRVKMLAMLREKYRVSRKVTEVLARKVGYSFHGYTLRKSRTMKAQEPGPYDALAKNFIALAFANNKAIQTGMQMRQALVEAVENLCLQQERMKDKCWECYIKARSIKARQRYLRSYRRLSREHEMYCYTRDGMHEWLEKEARNAN